MSLKRTEIIKSKEKPVAVNARYHILLVANTSWSIYNFRLGLIRHLIKQGYNVSVIAPKDRFTSELIAEGIPCFELKMNNYGMNPIADLRLIKQLVVLYKEIKPDLIFHYTIKPNIYGSIAAKICAIPSVAITTGLGHLFQFSNILVRWITRLAYRFAAWLADEVWFLNTNDRDIFVYKRIVKRAKTKVLKSEGINLNWFSATKEKDHKRNRFLFAGRLIWDKGVKEYILAAEQVKKKYPETEFEIVGFVDETNPNSVPFDYILEWQNKGVINYLGETSDIRPLLENTNCFVFPSYYREGVSRVLMEAAAMETVIITTDNVGCRDLVDDGKSGIIVQPQDIGELVKAIEQFINMSANDRMIMAKRGRAKMDQEFNEVNVLKSYIKFVEEKRNATMFAANDSK